MQTVTYSCDHCHKPVEKEDVAKLEISHGRGKFDLRDETFEICPGCDEALMKWIRRHDKA